VNSVLYPGIAHDVAAGGLRRPRPRLAGWESITNGTVAFPIAGSAKEAAAPGLILIVVAALSVIIINRVAGTRMGGVFG